LTAPIAERESHLEVGARAGCVAFDYATSKKLVAVTQTCDGFVIAHCQGASECIPARCMPNQNGYILDPPACPVLPEAGQADGG